MAMEPSDGDAILRDNFTPWIQHLGLTVESLADDDLAAHATTVYAILG